MPHTDPNPTTAARIRSTAGFATAGRCRSSRTAIDAAADDPVGVAVAAFKPSGLDRATYRSVLTAFHDATEAGHSFGPDPLAAVDRLAARARVSRAAVIAVLRAYLEAAEAAAELADAVDLARAAHPAALPA